MWFTCKCLQNSMTSRGIFLSHVALRLLSVLLFLIQLCNMWCVVYGVCLYVKYGRVTGQRMRKQRRLEAEDRYVPMVASVLKRNGCVCVCARVCACVCMRPCLLAFVWQPNARMGRLSQGSPRYCNARCNLLHCVHDLTVFLFCAHVWVHVYGCRFSWEVIQGLEPTVRGRVGL